MSETPSVTAANSGEFNKAETSRSAKSLDVPTIPSSYTNLTDSEGQGGFSGEHLSPSGSHGNISGRRRKQTSLFDDNVGGPVELPNDFRILPVYQDILENSLPPMELHPLFRPEDSDLDSVIKQMDKRIRKNPVYKCFVEETKNLLTYVLQERKLRKTIQENLKIREEEVMTLMERQQKDPRIPKILMMADHWRNEKDASDEHANSLQAEMSTVMLDMRALEIRMAAMQKRQEKMETQIQKSKACDQEKEQLEEQIMARDKALIDLHESVDALKTNLHQTEAEAASREHHLRAKLEAAPDRNATKLAALTRELELISIEKDYKKQEARELLDMVNTLVVDGTRTNARIKIMMGLVRSLRTQTRTLETKHQTLVVQNKFLQEQVGKVTETVKQRELDTMILQRENITLKRYVNQCQFKVKQDESQVMIYRRRISELEMENKELKADLLDKEYRLLEQKKDALDANKAVQKNEITAHLLHKQNQHETQRVQNLQRKLQASGRHISQALENVGRLSEQVDRTSCRLKGLDMELARCQSDNVRNQSLMIQLQRQLDSNGDMLRLKMQENDALVKNKHKMVYALRACQTNQTIISNEIARLTSAKITLEDAALNHQFMLDYVGAERDGFLRSTKLCEELLVVMKRERVDEVAQIVRGHSEMSELKLKLQEIQAQLTVQKREIYSMARALKIAEQNNQHFNNMCKTLMSQRDMFGKRLLQRNNEAELVNVKMKSMNRFLDSVTAGYREKCSDVSVLKKEIRNLRRRVKALEHTEALCEDLRAEVCVLSKTVSLETNKRTAIEHIREQRMHMTRELMNRNPSQYELIVRIQKLQRCLIQRTQESISKEKELSIKNDNIRHLQMAIRRRDSDRVVGHAVRSVAYEKNKKIKALTAEVNMLNFYHDINRKVTEDQRQELGTVKKKLLHFRRAKSAMPCTEKEDDQRKSSEPHGHTEVASFTLADRTRRSRSTTFPEYTTHSRGQGL